MQYYFKAIQLFDPAILFGKKTVQPSLHNVEGFTVKESEFLDFFAEKRRTGAAYGTMVGLFIAYAWRGWFKNLQSVLPIFVKRPQYKVIFQGIIVLTAMTIGNHISTGNRIGGNLGGIFNLTNNNKYRFNKEFFLEGFAPIDRLFTDQEKKHFIQRGANARPNRNWNYNPFIYDSQQEFHQLKFRVENNIEPWDHPNVLKNLGGKRLRPFFIQEHLSMNGAEKQLSF